MAKYPSISQTKNGRILIAKSNATGKALVPIKVITGDGQLTNQNIETMENVINPLLELPFASPGRFVKEGQFQLDFALSNEHLEHGFYAREIGVFAKLDGEDDSTAIMIAYTNGGNFVDYIPAKDTPINSKVFEITIAVDNATNVIVQRSDAAFLTSGEMERHNKDNNAHNEQFRKYLLLTGGTLTGDIIIKNGKWMICQNGDYEGDVRITQSGTMDVGVNRKSVVDNLNLCTKIRPGWYDGNSPAKPIAMTEDINNHNTDETAHQSITSMIAKILGSSDWKANPAASLKDIKNLLGMGGIVAQRLEETGFIKFANGLIIQWGIFRKVAEAEQGGNWNENQQVRRFPIQFATNKAVLVCGDSGIYPSSGNNALAAAVSGAVSVRGRIVDRTSFKVAVDASDGTVNADISYIAIGI